MFRVKGLPTQACLFVSLMFTELHDQFIFQFLSLNYGLICIMKAFPLFTENKTSCPPPCDLKICSLFPFSLRIKPFVFPFNPQTESQSPIPGGSPQNNTSFNLFLISSIRTPYFPAFKQQGPLGIPIYSHTKSILIRIQLIRVCLTQTVVEFVFYSIVVTESKGKVKI